MELLILIIILFVVADIIIRLVIKRITERRILRERQKALEVNLQLDFSYEAKTLKRVEVENPRAKILAVDDEEIILDSFRKILVLDGYSIDTVQAGQEALGLIQKHHYDFLFVDLKMPGMDGVEVCKSAKYLRPDIDVIIITGYASVETAVETMKFGAMDYVEKPFTEDELVSFVKKSLIKRQERIKKELKPRVNIVTLEDYEHLSDSDFIIPGGVFISGGHCWASFDQDGSVKVGIDDFAKKIIGKIEGIDFPNPGMEVRLGQPLFSIKQGQRSITFNSPFSGKVFKTNSALPNNLSVLDTNSYGKNWICLIDPDDLDLEIQNLKIGNSAVAFFQEEIEQFRNRMKQFISEDQKALKGVSSGNGKGLVWGKIGQLSEQSWKKLVREFFER
jgi:CheY-like chemotaxis protein